MHTLANSIRRTYNRLRHITDQIHTDMNLSAPKRTLLLDLSREGPQTVPKLSAFRHVSRQITQTQVNELIEENYAKASQNPAHKKSSLITLTPLGEKTVQKMIQNELEFIKKLGWLPENNDLEKCREVLDSIHEHLEM